MANASQQLFLKPPRDSSNLLPLCSGGRPGELTVLSKDSQVSHGTSLAFCSNWMPPPECPVTLTAVRMAGEVITCFLDKEDNGHPWWHCQEVLELRPKPWTSRPLKPGARPRSAETPPSWLSMALQLHHCPS